MLLTNHPLNLVELKNTSASGDISKSDEIWVSAFEISQIFSSLYSAGFFLPSLPQNVFGASFTTKQSKNLEKIMFNS